MKRLYTSALFMFMAICLSAQVIVDEPDLSSMTFVRQNFTRNFYNSVKIAGQINMEGTDLFLNNSANLVCTGEPVKLSQHGRRLDINSEKGGESFIRVSAFHPYFCYEVSFSSVDSGEKAGLAFYPNDGGEAVKVYYCDGAVEAIVKGGTVRKEVTVDENVTLRVQYTGLRFHVFIVMPDGSTPLLFSVTCDMRESSTVVTHCFGVYCSLPQGSGVTLHKACSMLTCGTGQADPQVVQNSDGTPYIRDGRLYICFTTRGFEQIKDSYQGVYSLDLSTYQLRLEGALFFGKGDGMLYGFHATKVVYDSGNFLVITTSHADTHTLCWAQTSTDIMHGIHFLECTNLEFPHSNVDSQGNIVNPAFNTEDPDFFYDAKARKWRLAYCALKDKSYVTYLCESRNWNGPYTQIAQSPKNNNTGIRITTVGGRRYVLSGGPETTFYIYDYPSLDYVGTFNQKFPNGGFRGWPTIVPVKYGNYERYLWITFDRGAQTGRYSYGTLYFYLSDQMWRAER